jgi:RimJ/RimL family protein N-acetyltransferase
MAERTQLRTDRLLLRPFSLTDVEDVVAFGSDQEYVRYLRRQDDEESVAQWVLRPWDRRPVFAIVFEEKVVGRANLDVDASNRIVELGYAIAREHWGKGLAAEAARPVMDWGFDAFDLAKVFATADARNIRSHRVLEKLGMQREATLRSHEIRRGERADIAYYGILREDWNTSG